jgi:hypothetical protein
MVKYAEPPRGEAMPMDDSDVRPIMAGLDTQTVWKMGGIKRREPPD